MTVTWSSVWLALLTLGAGSLGTTCGLLALGRERPAGVCALLCACLLCLLLLTPGQGQVG